MLGQESRFMILHQEGPVVCTLPLPGVWPPSTQLLLGQLLSGGLRALPCRAGGPGERPVARVWSLRRRASPRASPGLLGNSFWTTAFPSPHGNRACTPVSRENQPSASWLPQQRLWAQSATLSRQPREGSWAPRTEEPGAAQVRGRCTEGGPGPARVPGGNSPAAESLLSLGSCAPAHDEFRLQRARQRGLCRAAPAGAGRCDPGQLCGCPLAPSWEQVPRAPGEGKDPAQRGHTSPAPRGTFHVFTWSA